MTKAEDNYKRRQRAEIVARFANAVTKMIKNAPEAERPILYRMRAEMMARAFWVKQPEQSDCYDCELYTNLLRDGRTAVWSVGGEFDFVVGKDEDWKAKLGEIDKAHRHGERHPDNSYDLTDATLPPRNENYAALSDERGDVVTVLADLRAQNDA